MSDITPFKGKIVHSMSPRGRRTQRQSFKPK